MGSATIVASAREAFARHSWAEAYQALTTAQEEEPLGPEDLDRLATAAYLIGMDEESAGIWAQSHQAFLDRGDVPHAARSAFWLAYGLLNRGEWARGSGWLGRARRLLDEEGTDSVEAGYLLIPEGIRAVVGGEAKAGYETFGRAAEIGRRFGDADLVVLGRQGQGRALIRLGQIDGGLALLDEAMAAVEAGEISAMVAGDVYCSVIEACHEIFDFRRAHEWTEALSGWCESQPDLVPYRGECLVRRAELMQLHGAWSDAMSEAQRAGETLARPPGRPVAGEAFYRQAELHRLRGDFDHAEQAYREAARWSRKPRPGLALLRLAQGRLDAAEATIRRVLDETREPADRSTVLPAYIEIVLGAGDIDSARAAAEELRTIAAELDAILPRASAAEAEGLVCLAGSDPEGALERLRAAWGMWEVLDAPYQAARVRVPIALACRRLGDEDGATAELDAARWRFEQLGAGPDVERVQKISARGSSGEASHGLTPRELEVLRMVASGRANRAVAEQLFISERTVERHLSNIFRKLSVSSRTAATAYAHRHNLA